MLLCYMIYMKEIVLQSKLNMLLGLSIMIDKIFIILNIKSIAKKLRSRSENLTNNFQLCLFKLKDFLKLTMNLMTNSKWWN